MVARPPFSNAVPLPMILSPFFSHAPFATFVAPYPPERFTVHIVFVTATSSLFTVREITGVLFVCTTTHAERRG